MQTPLTPGAIAELRRRFPDLRDDYFDYLSFPGWGETEAGPMIYEGPIYPEEIYGPRENLAGIVLLGDDFQGYCFGYNVETECYGEVSGDGTWEPWSPSDEFARYVRDPDQHDP